MFHILNSILPFKMRNVSSFIVFYLAIVSSLAHSQSITTIDGLFSDWNDEIATYSDGLDNGNGIDLIDMQASNDEQYLYVKLTVNQELCIGNDLVDHQIWLSIDADNNANTGFPEQSGYGTELGVNLNGHYAWFNGPSGNSQVTLGDIGVFMAPTVTASEFEFALPLDIKPDGVNNLFTGDTIKIAFNDDKDGDRMPNSGTVFTYVLDRSSFHQRTPTTLDKSSEDHLRIVSHNILFNNGFSSSAITEMERVVTAINGDVYCFQECTEDTSNIRDYFNSWLPLDAGKSWHIGRTDNRVTVSRWPISETWELNRKTAHLIEVKHPSWEREILVINGHLSCCTNNDGRQFQVDELASFMLDARSNGGSIDLQDSTPMFFLGDMNFVGFNQQLKTVITGDIQDKSTFGQGGFLDWDDSELKDARPLHIDSNFSHTWRDLQGDGFPPGRLDYQFFTDAVVTDEKSFILDTERMTALQLNANNLQRNDTRTIADHLPVVVDYSLNKSDILSVPILRDKSMSLKVYPNPAKNIIHIDANGTIKSVQLKDVFGRSVISDCLGCDVLHLPETPKGMYIVKVMMEDDSVYQCKVVAGN
jgi:hypothetical protein